MATTTDDKKIIQSMDRVSRSYGTKTVLKDVSISQYSGAKAAVSNFTEWLAVHFAPSGIRVNAIAPGFFVTDQNRSLLFNSDGTPTARTEKILEATPMARFGKVEELIGAMNLLIDDKAASFITGVVLPIDGGFNAYSGV